MWTPVFRGTRPQVRAAGPECGNGTTLDKRCSWAGEKKGEAGTSSTGQDGPQRLGVSYHQPLCSPAAIPPCRSALRPSAARTATPGTGQGRERRTAGRPAPATRGPQIAGGGGRVRTATGKATRSTRGSQIAKGQPAAGRPASQIASPNGPTIRTKKSV